MFKIFKKKKSKSIQEWELPFLSGLVVKLPKKYSFLTNQMETEFILDSLENVFLKNGWKTIVFNQNQYDSFLNKTLNFKLSGIKVYDSGQQAYKNVELDINNGILIGYRIEGTFSGNFDFNKIDLSRFQEKTIDNEDKESLEFIIGTLDETTKSILDLENTFKLELEEGEFYTIKDLGNGDYLSVDNFGAVFGIIHDPPEVERLFDNMDGFFKALKAGDFDVNDYHDAKLS